MGYFAHYHCYKRVLKAASLREIRFHDLRHAFGSAAITKLDPYAVQSYLGHQHYSTTQRYLHHKPRREDAAALQEAFGGNVVRKLVPNSQELSATQRTEEDQDKHEVTQQPST
ncbi:MAG: tyrosine-type recombinase/integrase [Solirubrobacterales bacterium]